MFYWFRELGFDISKIAIIMFRCLNLDWVLLLSLFITYPRHLLMHWFMFILISKSWVWFDLGLYDFVNVCLVSMVGYAYMVTSIYVRYIFVEIHHWCLVLEKCLYASFKMNINLSGSRCVICCHIMHSTCVCDMHDPLILSRLYVGMFSRTCSWYFSRSLIACVLVVS